VYKTAQEATKVADKVHLFQEFKNNVGRPLNAREKLYYGIKIAGGMTKTTGKAVSTVGDVVPGIPNVGPGGKINPVTAGGKVVGILGNGLNKLANNALPKTQELKPLKDGALQPAGGAVAKARNSVLGLFSDVKNKGKVPDTDMYGNPVIPLK
jgi:hypothetical protein